MKQAVKDLLKEAKWLPVYGYEGFYEVSDDGQVRSVDRDVTHSRNNNFTRTVTGRILSQSKNPQGYYKVRLSKLGEYKTCLIHHLVSESFLGHTNRSSLVCVDHIDEDIQNNNLDNLQIISKQENTKKSFYYKLDKFKKGDWWFHNNGTLLLILEVKKTHGGTLKCNPIYNCVSENKFSYHKIAVLERLATDKEVEEALIKEAKKRGFKAGVKYINAMFGNFKETARDNVFKLYGDGNGLYLNRNTIFYKGKWAEIINKEPKEITVDGITYIPKQ